MKRLISICTFIVLSAFLGGLLFAQKIAQKKADNATMHWRYELQACVGQAPKGCAIARVWTYSTNVQVATMQAGKNAVHGIIFTGIAPTNDSQRLPGVPPLIADPAIEEQHADYFRSFFADGGAYQRYVSFMANGTPDQVIKIGREYKVGLVVTVQTEALRKRLEDDNIIPKMTETAGGKVPTLMVVPSNQWCHEHGYVTEQGNIDYARALNESKELSQVISQVNGLFAARNFPLKNLESCLKTLNTQAAEDMLTQSKSGSDIAVSPLDKLKEVAHADMWVQVNWWTESLRGGTQKAMHFQMQALDGYNDTQVGEASGTGTAVLASEAQTTVLLEEAIVGHMETFAAHLMDYFKELTTIGRPVRIRILIFADDFDGDLESDYDGSELQEIIEDWVAEHAVGGRYNTPIGTAYQMLFDGVYIPLTNEKGRSVDARNWLRNLQKYLQQQYSIESKLTSRGLGEATLILGGK